MYGKEPMNCEQCIPVVLEGNKEAMEVFNLIRNQHIMGFGGPVDLNMQSAEFVMNLLGIKDRKTVFRKAYLAYKTNIKLIVDEAEAERLRRKNESKEQR